MACAHQKVGMGCVRMVAALSLVVFRMPLTSARRVAQSQDFFPNFWSKPRCGGVEGAVKRPSAPEECKCENHHEKVFCGMTMMEPNRKYGHFPGCPKKPYNTHPDVPYCALQPDPYRVRYAYVPIAQMKPTTLCAEEFGLDGTDQGQGHDNLLDVVKTMRGWCNPLFVPEEKRMPEQLHGFYWMRGLAPDEDYVGFCASNAEWDPQTRTATLAPWTHFVFRRKVGGPTTPPLWRKVTDGRMLIVNLTFTDPTLSHGRLTSNSPFANFIGDIEINEAYETPDGLVNSDRQGDLFERPKWIMGVRSREVTQIPYYAVRVADWRGKGVESHYELMKREASGVPSTLIHYRVRCGLE